MYNKKRFIKLLSAGMLVCVAVTSAQAANDNIHLQYTVPKVEASFVFFDDFDVENPEKMMGSFMKNMMDASNQGNQGNQGSKGDNPGKQMFQTILKLGAEQIQKGQSESDEDEPYEDESDEDEPYENESDEDESYGDEPYEDEPYEDESYGDEQYEAGYVAGEKAEVTYEMRLDCIGFTDGLDDYYEWVEDKDPLGIDGTVSDAKYDSIYDDLHEVIRSYALGNMTITKLRSHFTNVAPTFKRDWIWAAPCD